ncbi:uncharacterized protein LOC132205615 [Neocloeon triangulifer]|uniref:uncharacterized protein LOC132205615 n=1 Tax=Neocloeon triangulifer TaxID=2078957 RepID=UPI00286EE051|nr:uncharacterized protein LOC132205615 [Neocloeon triangulifer]
MEVHAAGLDWMNEFVRRPSRRHYARAPQPPQVAEAPRKNCKLNRSWTISNPQSSPEQTPVLSRNSPAYSSLPRSTVRPAITFTPDRQTAEAPDSVSQPLDLSPEIILQQKEKEGEETTVESSKETVPTAISVPNSPGPSPTAGRKTADSEPLDLKKILNQHGCKSAPQSPRLELSRRHMGCSEDEGAAGSPAPSPAAVLLMDYALDGSKMQPDSDDYKLVFISSDSSSKESNSDIEFALEDCDWDYFESTAQREKMATPTASAATPKREEPPSLTSTALLGGSFGEMYERPAAALDRQWSLPELMRLQSRATPSHSCENCGFELLHGLSTNFVPIPYPVPVPIAVPVPFSGSEADFLEALRVKLRPPMVPPYLHQWYQNLLRDSWQEKQQSDLRPVAVMTPSLSPAVDKQTDAGVQCDISEMQTRQTPRDLHDSEDAQSEHSSSEEEEEVSDDEEGQFSTVFVVNASDSESVEDEEEEEESEVPDGQVDELIVPTVQLKSVRQLDTGDDDEEYHVSPRRLSCDDEVCAEDKPNDKEESIENTESEIMASLKAVEEKLELLAGQLCEEIEDVPENLQQVEIECDESVESEIPENKNLDVMENSMEESEILENSSSDLEILEKSSEELENLENLPDQLENSENSPKDLEIAEIISEDLEISEELKILEDLEIPKDSSVEISDVLDEAAQCISRIMDEIIKLEAVATSSHLIELAAAGVEGDSQAAAARDLVPAPECEPGGSAEGAGGAAVPESAEDAASCGSGGGGFTSYVMITQQGKPTCPEQGEPDPDEDADPKVNVSVHNEKIKINHTTQEEEDAGGFITLHLQNEVQIVSNDKTMSQVCLEEGLADDDSWVEEASESSSMGEASLEIEEEVEVYQDREEELRGYHRAIDFTLHTILEESCEESDVDEEERGKRKKKEKERESRSELEKYFIYGITGQLEDREDDDSDDQEEPSPLEKYFLSSFQQDSDTDESGSVGSDSEGRPSPEQRRKRLVRARGTMRHSLERDDASEVFEVNDDSTETDSCENGGKRSKKKKHRPMVYHHEDNAAGGVDMDEPEDGAKTPQPELPPEPPQPTRKHHSRDSGFIGSCDDLLKTGPSGSSSSSNEEQPAELKTPIVSPVPSPVLPEVPPLVPGPPRANNSLARKDSFNNWSSDEETNLMMSKMRALFKTMVNGGKSSAPPAVVANGPPNNNNNAKSAESPRKPPQLVYFESELTRLMKTVPGIKDEQVKEIVEYLSSEDTWSDSYDSSDYTSSDLEGPRSELQQQISASCQEIIQNFDPMQEEEKVEPSGDGLVYQRLVKSLSKMSSESPNNNSPPLMAKVMHHIGSRLVALMHEVSAASDLQEAPPSPKPRFRKLHRQQFSPASSSLDESDSPGGSDTESRVRRHPSLPRSKSHDLGQWEHLLQERGVPRESLRSSSSGVSDLEREDYERFSWRGSFESALAADSRSKLSFEAKRRSTGSGSASDLFSSNDQLDNRGRVRSCGSIGSRASLPGRGGARLSSSGGDLLTAAESELLDARRRGSVPDATPRSTTLPRSSPAASASTNSLPRLPLSASPVVAAIHKSYSAQLHAQQHSPVHHTHHHHFLQNVKSARYRPPNFRPPPLGPPKRTVSAPGLHHATRRNERRSRPLSGDDLEDVGSLSNCSTPQGGTPQGTLQSKSKSTPSSEWPGNNEEDVDCLVAMHHQRSTAALGVRSDSMASVYSGAGDGRYGTVAVRGEVEFGMQYNYKAGALEILVKQCRDLAPVDAKRSRSDPYVKVYLLPDKSKSGKRKTKVKKHTLNPIFEETLKFQLTLQGLETRTLWLTVWHSDMFGRNDFLGEVMMSLENVVFDDPTPKWYPLQERTEPFEELISYKGDIIVGLKFVPPEVSSMGNGKKKNKQPKGSLHVLVKEAKNLTAVKTSGTSDPFCKSYLLPEKGRGSKQKTSVARRSCNPAWNHTFVYEDVTLQELAERSLELTVWDHDRLASNEFLGGLRFNLGSGKHFGKSVDWMDASGKEMSLWQLMLERPNFWVEGSLSLRPTLDIRHNTSCASSIATSDS